MSAPSILIMAGGTGGHVFPALAVAGYLARLGWRVTWLGTRHGMEADLVSRHGYPMEFVRAGALRGKGLLRALTLPISLITAFWQSVRVLRKVRPDVVLGMGGYVAFPGGMMASLLGRPLAIHEQNSVAGLTNRVLSRLAQVRLTGFPAALPASEWTGNPVRDEFATQAHPQERYRTRHGALNLLVFGGSLGAQALNEAVPGALRRIASAERPRAVHQSGRQHLSTLQARYKAAGVEAETLTFIDDMATRLAAADLVICRAGASTVAELAAVGVASILVPYPHAVDDHQTRNARFLSDAGAAVLLPQRELSGDRLAMLLRSLDRGQLREMALKAHALAKPNATATVARACMSLTGVNGAVA